MRYLKVIIFIFFTSSVIYAQSQQQLQINTQSQHISLEFKNIIEMYSTRKLDVQECEQKLDNISKQLDILYSDVQLYIKKFLNGVRNNNMSIPEDLNLIKKIQLSADMLNDVQKIDKKEIRNFPETLQKKIIAIKNKINSITFLSPPAVAQTVLWIVLFKNMEFKNYNINKSKVYYYFVGKSEYAVDFDIKDKKFIIFLKQESDQGWKPLKCCIYQKKNFTSTYIFYGIIFLVIVILVILFGKNWKKRAL